MDRGIHVGQAVAFIKPEVRFPVSLAHSKGTKFSYYSVVQGPDVVLDDKYNMYQRMIWSSVTVKDYVKSCFHSCPIWSCCKWMAFGLLLWVCRVLPRPRFLSFHLLPSWKSKPSSLKTNTGTGLQGTSSLQMQQRCQEGAESRRLCLHCVPTAQASQESSWTDQAFGGLWSHGDKATCKQFFPLSLLPPTSFSSGHLRRD